MPDNPLPLFEKWLNEAIEAQTAEPTAVLVELYRRRGYSFYPHCFVESSARRQICILHQLRKS